MNCPICQHEAQTSSPNGLDGWHVNCPRCGNYKISRTAAVNLQAPLAVSDRLVANASGWISEHQNELISTVTAERLLKLSTPSYEERKRKFLEYLNKHSESLGKKFEISKPVFQSLVSASWCLDDREINFLISSAESDALVKHDGNGVSLTAKGYDYLSQLNKNSESQIGFCAMWFDGSVSHLWDKAIEPAIVSSGYQPLRIDKKEHVNRIDDEIFADIRRSRFVIADFTHGDNGVRGGVYFEAGFAQGLGLPVIWTCREDMLAEDKLHFDIRQYNFIVWSENNLDEFCWGLQRRIEAILGRGTWKPNS